MKIIWAEPALSRLDKIFQEISDDDPDAALRVCDQIEASTLKLSDFPNIGRMGRVTGTREKVVSGLPYIVVYEVFPSEIRIMTVRHTSQEWPESFEEEKLQ